VILLALGDTAAARTTTIELAHLAATLDAPPLRALADRAEGSVLIAEGEDSRRARAPSPLLDGLAAARGAV